jgi:tetratricopeptide (TPR) repeat protein
MLKFTIGALILLGAIVSFTDLQKTSLMDKYELQGFLFGKVIIIAIAIWLVYSGGKKLIKDFKSERKVKINFIEFIRQFFGDYEGFLKNYIKKIHTPFLFLVIWISGISYLFDVIEGGSLVPDQISQLDNWLYVWLYAVLLGLLFGFIVYTIGGTLFHIPVWLSGGEKDMRASRRILIYASQPVSIAIILSKIFYTIAYGNSYFTQAVDRIWIYLWLLIVFAATMYVTMRIYKGVRLVQKTEKIRSMVFFIVTPVLFYAFVFTGLAIKASKTSDVSSNYNKQAVQYIHEENYPEAKKALDAALENVDENTGSKDYIQLYINQAAVAKSERNKDLANGYYQKALSLTSDTDAEYFSINGQIDTLNNDIDSAIENFKKALGIDPNNFEANNNLGLIYLFKKNEDERGPEQALIYNKKAYEISKDINTIENLAYNYYSLMEFDYAYPLYKELLLMDPGHVRGKYFLGLIYYIDGNYKDSKLYLEEAIASDSDLLTEDTKKILDNINEKIINN